MNIRVLEAFSDSAKPLVFFVTNVSNVCGYELSWSSDTQVCVLLQRLNPNLMNYVAPSNVTAAQSKSSTLSRSSVGINVSFNALFDPTFSCVLQPSGPWCLCAAGFEGNGTFCKGKYSFR